MKEWTKEELEAELPYLFEKWGDDWETTRGTEYMDGYDITYRFGIDQYGFSTERRTVRYYYPR